MPALGIASLGLMAIVGVIVGGRLLALARRTRGFPELAIGLGLLLLAVVGGPLAAIGRLPALVGTATGDLLFATGLAVVQAGIGLFFAFNWRVFRPHSRLAAAAVAAAGLALALEWLGLVRASAGGRTMEEILPHTRPFGIAIVLTLAAAFAWTAFESFAWWSRLRKRTEIGLADPVVADRMRLWGAAGVAVATLCAVLALSMAMGLAPMRHAVPLGCIALAAIVASVCWTLAFLAPASYREGVRARAARATSAIG